MSPLPDEEYMTACGLTEQEKHIIRLRYGLPYPDDNTYYYGRGMTLDKIAKIFSLSRERIRQFQERGIRKMKLHIDRFTFSSYD